MDSTMIDKLKSMLDDPSTLAALSAIMGTMTPKQKNIDENSISVQEQADDRSVVEDISPAGENFGNSQADAIMRIQELMSQASTDSDPRINLLSSLKPYMRQSRSAKMDQAIKLIQIAKIASVFKQTR